MRGVDLNDEEVRSRGKLYNAFKENWKKNAGKLKEAAISFTKKTGVVQSLPEKVMELKSSLLFWLHDLHERSKDEEERRLLTFLIHKIDRVFQLDDMIVTYWLQNNPKPNPLVKEFNESIAALEADKHSEVNTSIIKSVKELAPDLEWYIKKAACLETHGETTEYVNANIIGERGVIYDDKLTVGLTVMPPNIQYPEHQHVAEEFYLVLSDGQWNKHSGEWEDRKLGDYVYNESNIVHSTRSGDKPLVTLWFHYHPNEIQNFAYKYRSLPKKLMEKLGRSMDKDE